MLSADRPTEWRYTHPVRWGNLRYRATRSKITDYHLIEVSNVFAHAPCHRVVTISSPLSKIFGPVIWIPNNTLRDSTTQHVIHEWSVQCTSTAVGLWDHESILAQLDNKLWGDGVVQKKNFHTHTHTRHPDWLSRASQHARGATKNIKIKLIICKNNDHKHGWLSVTRTTRNPKLLERHCISHSPYTLHCNAPTS